MCGRFEICTIFLISCSCFVLLFYCHPYDTGVCKSLITTRRPSIWCFLLYFFADCWLLCCDMFCRLLIRSFWLMFVTLLCGFLIAVSISISSYSFISDVFFLYFHDCFHIRFMHFVMIYFSWLWFFSWQYVSDFDCVFSLSLFVVSVFNLLLFLLLFFVLKKIMYIKKKAEEYTHRWTLNHIMS